METLAECSTNPGDKLDLKKAQQLRSIWTSDITALFVQSRLTHDNLFTPSNGNLGWKTVLSDVRSMTGNNLFTLANVSKKWWNMCRIYKDYKKIMETSRIPWPYYYMFDNYYQEKKNINNSLKCRLCQKEKGVFSLQIDNLGDQIKKYLDIKISDNSKEGFICIPCKSKIDNFHLFWLQCHAVDEDLHSAQNDVQKSEVLHSVTVSYVTDKNKLFKKEINTTNTVAPDFQQIYIQDKEEISYVAHEVIISDEIDNIKKENTEIQDPIYTKEPSLEEIFDIKDDKDPLDHIESSSNPKHTNVTQFEKISGTDFTCSYCLEKFDTQGKLNRHFKTHHVRHVCTAKGCGKTYGSQRSLMEHSLKFHEGKWLFLCTICGKGYNNKSNFKSHENSHTGNKAFECDMCDKKYFMASSLLAHKKKDHYKMFSYCSKCMKPFRSDSALRRHEIVHTGIKKFSCTIDDTCDYSCFTKRELVIHERRHEGKRPHACKFCPKTFSQKHHLIDHEKVHAGILAFTCSAPGCGKQFVNRGKMNKHMKIHNK